MSAPMSPRVLIAQALLALDRSQVEAARMAGISAKHLNQVISGRAGISADVAVRLEPAVGVSAEVLLIAQALCQVAAVRDRR